jgi:hypothetical protein
MTIFFLLLKIVPRSFIKPNTYYECRSKLDATEKNNIRNYNLYSREIYGKLRREYYCSLWLTPALYLLAVDKCAIVLV